MIARTLARLVAMDAAELAWRVRTAGRQAIDRGHAALAAPVWKREVLPHILARTRELDGVRAAAVGGRWGDAHAELAGRLSTQPARFIIAPSLRRHIVNQVSREFPGSAREAAARGDRLLAGEYDLLGYRAIQFGPASSIDWHYDPVHARRSPVRFWATVPFLDPSCGDHKIIWELNRHQHWLALGRAFWLTGEPRYREGALAQLESWLAANPPLIGINWASMLELGFRTLSWLWALNFFVDAESKDHRPWLVDLFIALDRQLEHIERNLSYYFSPNTHLLGEALALYVSGRVLPELKASPRREALGRRILIGEIARQIAPDGGHCERSPYYHRYALDFYLIALAVARITDDPAAASFEGAVASLAFAARLLADDRGRLPHFGDDDGGMASPIVHRAADDVSDSLSVAAALTARADLRVGALPEEAFWLLAHPRLAQALEALRSMPLVGSIGSAALPDTGYYISRSSAGDHLVIDGGPHGHQNGGHAHADALSLTLTVRGVMLLTDPGTGCYTIDPGLRDRFRSTALHNTLMLDERPQSIPAGPFHWSRMANAAVRRWRTNPAFDYFEGVHDGYRPHSHRRHVLVLPGDLVLVADLVDGDETHRADVHWHLDPRWRVALSGQRAVLTAAGERVEFVTPHGIVELFAADEQTGLGWQAPIYGRVERAATLRVALTSSAPFWVLSVFGLDPANEVTDVETVPVWAEAGTLANSFAARISRAGSTDYFLIAEPLRDARVSWRLGDLETDACMLFYRADLAGAPVRLALVDGSLMCATAGRRLRLALPRRVPDLHLDLARPPDRDEAAEVRLSGSAFGARVGVGDRELPVAVERRAVARSKTPSR
jgi:uncharacterized heparinase superfamily protein